VKSKPKIITYFHCKNCQSGKLTVGMTKDDGLQVYCEDCEMSVVEFTSEVSNDGKV
jgi:hypothetical protein